MFYPGYPSRSSLSCVGPVPVKQIICMWTVFKPSSFSFWQKNLPIFMPISPYVMEKMQSQHLSSVLKFSVVRSLVVIFRNSKWFFLSLPSDSHNEFLSFCIFLKLTELLSLPPRCQTTSDKKNPVRVFTSIRPFLLFVGEDFQGVLKSAKRNTQPWCLK